MNCSVLINGSLTYKAKPESPPWKAVACCKGNWKWKQNVKADRKAQPQEKANRRGLKQRESRSLWLCLTISVFISSLVNELVALEFQNPIFMASCGFYKILQRLVTQKEKLSLGRIYLLSSLCFLSEAYKFCCHFCLLSVAIVRGIRPNDPFWFRYLKWHVKSGFIEWNSSNLQCEYRYKGKKLHKQSTWWNKFTFCFLWKGVNSNII